MMRFWRLLTALLCFFVVGACVSPDHQGIIIGNGFALGHYQDDIMSFDYELIFEASQQTEWQSLPAQWMEDSGERLNYGVTLENSDMGTATWAVLASHVSLSEFATLAAGLGLHDYGVRWRHQTFADIQSGYERYAMFIPQAVTGRVVVGGDSTGIVGTVVLFDISLGSDPHAAEHLQIVKDSLSLQMVSSGTYGVAR